MVELKSSRICVKGIGKNATEKDLKELFSKKGEVTDAKIILNKDGKSRRTAFVGFRNVEQAEEACSYYNNTFLGTSRIVVEVARKMNDAALQEKKIKLRNKESGKNGEKNDEKNDGKKDEKKDEKKNTTKEEPKKLTKKQAEFIAVMQPRGNKWANDDDMQVDEVAIPTAKKVVNDSSDDDDDDDENDINDFNVIDPGKEKEKEKEKAKEKEKEKAAPSKGPVSDMDYLRSKMTKKVDFEGEEGEKEEDSDSDSDSDESSAKESETKTGKTKQESSKSKSDQIDEYEEEEEGKDNFNEDDDDLESGRLFVVNVPFSCTEDEILPLFEAFGPVSELHVPLDMETRKSKGFAFVQFMIPEHADKALEELSGSSFQGRLLRVSKAKKSKSGTEDLNGSETNNYTKSSFKVKKEEERRRNANKREGWNTAHVRADTVVEALAGEHGVSSSAILDTTEAGGELAVRLAIGETQVIKENRDYFLEHGVDLDVLESRKSDSRSNKRSTTTILVKNLPYDVVPDELESMFSKYGVVQNFLLPKSKALALIDYVEPTEARAAYKGLAYRSYKHVPLYLEWAPLGVIEKKEKEKDKSDKNKKSGSSSSSSSSSSNSSSSSSSSSSNNKQTPAESDKEYCTLFIKNLNFQTADDALADHATRMQVRGLRAVSIMKKTKGNAILSQGFGFIEFDSYENASEAVTKLNGSVLDSHALQVKPSEKRLSAGNAAEKVVLKKNQSGLSNCKLIVRNLAFQATKTELASLFSTFGVVKRIRIPQKMGGEHRGFAFIDFSTAQEATNAKTSLSSTHLYGRHLVLEWAKEDEDDNVKNNETGVSSVMKGNSKLNELRKRAAIDQQGIMMDRKKAKSSDPFSEQGEEYGSGGGGGGDGGNMNGGDDSD